MMIVVLSSGALGPSMSMYRQPSIVLMHISSVPSVTIIGGGLTEAISLSLHRSVLESLHMALVFRDGGGISMSHGISTSLCFFHPSFPVDPS